MSITTDCVDYISLHGPADGVQIAASLGITYEQALKALNNAKYLGRLETHKPAQALGRGKGRTPAVYRIPKEKQRLTAAFANRNSICQPEQRLGTGMKHTLESLRARTTEDGDCLIWTGSDNGKGIPKVKNGNGGMSVRRVVWELRKGKIPDGKQVIVTCGHAGCIEHLALATKAQVSKAAQSRPDVRAHRSATSAKAARAKAKLTMELAQQIRNDPREGIVVAAELGVCKSTVSHVRRNRTWVDRSNPFAGLVAMNDSKRKAA